MPPFDSSDPVRLTGPEINAALKAAARRITRAVRRGLPALATEAMRELWPLIESGQVPRSRASDRLVSAVEEAGARAGYGRALVAWLMTGPRRNSYPPQDKHEKPTITIRPDNLPEQVDQAEAALIDAQLGVYRFGGRLVRLGTTIHALPRGGAIERLLLVDLNDHALRELFDRAATWEKLTKAKANVEFTKPAGCPMEVARAYLARGGLGSGVPALNGIHRSPTMRPNGDVLDLPGYDMESGLFMDFDPDTFPEIADQPSYHDAQHAISVLCDLLTEFPFTDGRDDGPNAITVSESVALSAILTAVARPALPAAPMHAVTATSIGTGKSYLVDIVATIATGEPVPAIAAGANDEELEKRLGAELMAGRQFIVIDNVTREINGDLLNQVLTQAKVAPRRLGYSENVEVACTAFVMANGNNLSIAADMARRVLMCGLDARVERPETREFDRDPLEAVRADRGQYVAAALTILRAYVVAGRPRCPKPVGSYEAWSSLVRGALIWLGCPDPAESMSAVREADPRRLQMLAVMAQWAEVIGDARSTVAEIIAAAVCRPGGEFREALLAVAGERGAIDGRRLGRWLGANKGRIVGARWFEAGPLRHGTGTWVLRGDDVGSVPAPSPDRMSDFP